MGKNLWKLDMKPFTARLRLTRLFVFVSNSDRVTIVSPAMWFYTIQTSDKQFY